MGEEPKDEWGEPLPVMSYASKRRTLPIRRAFGNVAGNVAFGFLIFLISCFVGPLIANMSGARDAMAYLALPATTLTLGVAAAFMPRYRGLLTGMLLLAIGIPLLIYGICFWR